MISLTAQDRGLNPGFDVQELKPLFSGIDSDESIVDFGPYNK